MIAVLFFHYDWSIRMNEDDLKTQNQKKRQDKCKKLCNLIGRMKEPVVEKVVSV